MTPISLRADVRDELADLSSGAKKRTQVAGKRAKDFLDEAFAEFNVLSPSPSEFALQAQAYKALQKAREEIDRALVHLESWETYHRLYTKELEE